jgi:hypothetical protein
MAVAMLICGCSSKQPPRARETVTPDADSLEFAGPVSGRTTVSAISSDRTALGVILVELDVSLVATPYRIYVSGKAGTYDLGPTAASPG